MIETSNLTIDELFEQGFALIQVGKFRLMQEGKNQEAYDEFGIVLNLLMEDRQHLREVHKVKS